MINRLLISSPEENKNIFLLTYEFVPGYNTIITGTGAWANVRSAFFMHKKQAAGKFILFDSQIKPMFLMIGKEYQVMSKLFVPEGYKPALSVYETQTAIGKINRLFEDNLARPLIWAGYPLPFCPAPHRINDDLNGIERPLNSISRKRTGQRSNRTFPCEMEKDCPSQLWISPLGKAYIQIWMQYAGMRRWIIFILYMWIMGLGKSHLPFWAQPGYFKGGLKSCGSGLRHTGKHCRRIPCFK